jgi:hypothetical protein
MRKETSVKDPRNYSRLAAVIFAVIALLQLLRAIFAREITLNGGPFPYL